MRIACVLWGATLLLAVVVSVDAQQIQFSNVGYVNVPVNPELEIPVIKGGGLKVGPLVLHPHLGVGEGITDNLFRSSQPFGSRERDSYTIYSPGLQAQVPFLHKHILVLNYQTYLERYSRFHTENTNDQQRDALLVLNFPGGLSVKGLAQWKDGHDLRGTALSTAGRTSGPNTWFTSTYGGEGQMAERTFARFRLLYTRWQYTGPNAGARDGSGVGDINFRNRLEQYAALALGGRIAAHTYVYLEGSGSHSIYEINKMLDNSVYTATVGLKLLPTAKTDGELKIGWERKALDRAPLRGSSEFSGLHVDGRLFWRPRERTLVSLFLYRRANDTMLADTTYYISTGTSLSVLQTVHTKWRVGALFGYNHDRYSNPLFSDNKFVTRDDNYLSAGLGIWYQVRSWLGLRAEYLYTQRLSNLDSSQYNANFGMVSVQAQF